MYRNQLRTVVIPLLGICALMLPACDGTEPLGPGAAEGFGPTDVASASALPSSPVVATFAKEFVPGESTETLLVWHGTVTMDGMTGDLVSVIELTEPDTRFAGGTLHATVQWAVTGDLEIEFETRGVVNFSNGLVRTNGRVVDGLYAGSRVHQQGQLDAMLNASGFLRIAPASGR